MDSPPGYQMTRLPKKTKIGPYLDRIRQILVQTRTHPRNSVTRPIRYGSVCRQNRFLESIEPIIVKMQAFFDESV